MTLSAVVGASPTTQVVPADQLPLAALVAAFAAVDKSNKTNPNRNNKLLLVVESDFTIKNGKKNKR
jgi:hypothetical protein